MFGLRLLLTLLPADFRREFGEELIQTAGDELATRGGPRSRFWLRQYWAIVRVAIRLRTGSGILGGADHSRRERRHGLSSFPAAMMRDLRHAGRSLRGSPLFTATAVMTLAMGVGATTAMFSALDARIGEAAPDDPLTEERAMLAEMEDELRAIDVPLSYMEEFYHLRLHADLVRRQLEARDNNDA